MKASYILQANGLSSDVATGVLVFGEKRKQMEAMKVVLLAELHGNKAEVFLPLLEVLLLYCDWR